MGKSKYEVLVGYDVSLPTNNPQQAIKGWFRNQPKHSMDVSIIAYNNEDAISLIDYAYEHKDMIKDLHSKYKNPYKLQYLLDQIDKKHDDRCKYFHSPMDKIHPFDEA